MIRLNLLPKKTCTGCGKLVPITGFSYDKRASDGRQSRCLECFREYKRKNRAKVYAAEVAWKDRNRELLRANRRRWVAENHDRLLEYQRSYHPAWVAKNAEAQRAYKREYVREQYRTSLQVRLTRILRSRLSSALKAAFLPNRQRQRTVSAVRDLGCSIPDLVKHLESLFVAGMTWRNHGEAWHVDHVRPLASFDLAVDEQARQACHWTNLQPMWGSDNIAKATKWDAATWRPYRLPGTAGA